MNLNDFWNKLKEARNSNPTLGLDHKNFKDSIIGNNGNVNFDAIYATPTTPKWFISLKKVAKTISELFFTVYAENSSRKLWYQLQSISANDFTEERDKRFWYIIKVIQPQTDRGVLIRIFVKDLYDNAKAENLLNKKIEDITEEECNEIINKILEIISFLVKVMSINPIIKYRHNVIYFGAPGTGKSFLLNKDKADLLCANNNDHENSNQPPQSEPTIQSSPDGTQSGSTENTANPSNQYDDYYERVTFYAGYSYSQFVGSYKPVVRGVGEITYKFQPGPFLRMLVNAAKPENENKKYLLIIEEINRANAAAVFGDMFQLLDRDDEGKSEYPVATSEDMKIFLQEKGLSGDIIKKIYLPKNFYIWATMNSADQGVFPLDTAFKRRWDYCYLSANDDANTDMKITVGGKLLSWNKVRKAINDLLLEKGKINEDKLLGPWFVRGDIISSEDFVNKVLMYLWEDAARMCRTKIFNTEINSFTELKQKWEKHLEPNGDKKCSLNHIFNFEDDKKFGVQDPNDPSPMRNRPNESEGTHTTSETEAPPSE